MDNPTNTELAGYLREWAKEMDADESGRHWLVVAADRLMEDLTMRALREAQDLCAQPAEKPTVPEVMPMVRAYYAEPENVCGGSLHIVLDDCNVRDSDVEFCIEYAKERGDRAGVLLGEILRRMSKTQRLKIAQKIYE